MQILQFPGFIQFRDGRIIKLRRISLKWVVYMAAHSLQPPNLSKVRTMINWWHLLWIVPAAALAGLITEALLIISKDEDDK